MVQNAEEVVVKDWQNFPPMLLPRRSLKDWIGRERRSNIPCLDERIQVDSVLKLKKDAATR